MPVKKRRLVKKKKKTTSAAAVPVEETKPMYELHEYMDPAKFTPVATLKICLATP